MTMWPACLHYYDDGQVLPAESLAADEAHLQKVNVEPSRALLRIWESPAWTVVVGRSNVIETEVDVAACAADCVPILRRCSGGGAVVIGPGCLCFTLVLPIQDEHRRAGVAAVTADIMRRLAMALSTATDVLEVCGISDLVWRGRKVSGNSQRWLRQALLHHGTVLYDFDVPRVGRYLRSPSRQPDYRNDRAHAEFVTNLALPRDDIAQRLKRTWGAQ